MISNHLAKRLIKYFHKWKTKKLKITRNLFKKIMKKIILQSHKIILMI